MRRIIRKELGGSLAEFFFLKYDLLDCDPTVVVLPRRAVGR